MFEKKLDFDFKINQEILKRVSAIDSFKATWSAIEKKENRYLKELRQIATIQSIGSSTRIEGATMNDEEIQALLKNMKIMKFKSRDEQEVVGYYEVIDLIYSNFKDISLSENYIKQLHGMLLKHSGKDVRHRGNYKNFPNKVVANYPDGQQKVIFNTSEPHLVDKELREVLQWTNEQIETKKVHPLLSIPVFIYEFLSIHPFQDGNGRLSRLLTTLLLLKLDYSFVPYISFENIIERRKKEYYEALMIGQKSRNTDKEKIDTWILFFLDCLHEMVDLLGRRYDLYKNKGGYLNLRQKEVLETIRINQPVKFGDIVIALPAYSQNTIKKDLQYLIKEHQIESVGRNKGTVYYIKFADKN
ncbi:MAG: Fic family protein [Mariniphaga sp.]